MNGIPNRESVGSISFGIVIIFIVYKVAAIMTRDWRFYTLSY